MDPNMTLLDLRFLFSRLRRLLGEDRANPQFDLILNAMASDISERFGALDEWLSNGGFLPTAWER